MDDAQGVVVLQGETKQYVLEGALPLALIPLLDGDHGCDQIADLLADRFDQALVYYHLLRLERMGLLWEGRCPEPDPAQALLTRLGVDPSRLDAPIDLGLTAVGGLDTAAALERLARLGSFRVFASDQPTTQDRPVALWLVLTPDYLDPELARFNRLALERGWRWLPCKPHGVQPCFGPLIAPGASACLECLLHRLRGHRPLLAKAVAQNGLAPPRLAQGWRPSSLDAFWGLVGLELEKALGHGDEAFVGQGVVSLDLQSLAIGRHRLVRRPQCPVCGDAAAWGRLPQRPPELRSRPKSRHRDGGERIVSAAQTLAEFESRVSPITGEVGALVDDTSSFSPLGRLSWSSWALLGDHRRFQSSGHGQEPRDGRAAPLGFSTGKGQTRAQARASALGEALERYCSQFCGYEPVTEATWRQVRHRAVDPRQLLAFSQAQYARRGEWARRGWTAFVPEPFDDDAAIDWAPAWSLSQRRWKLVPAACVYYNYPHDRGGRFARADSNGVAAGNCLEEAFMQGFFELVERDAVALWWYNRIGREAVDLDSLGGRWPREVRAYAAERDHDLHVLNLSADLPATVLAAVAIHRSDPTAPPMLGFGCHFDAEIALDRALGEVAQSFKAPPNLTPLTTARRLLGHELSQDEILRPRPELEPKSLREFVNLASDDFLDDLQLVVETMARRGLEVLMVDLTRPEVGLSVVRVMAPGLAHFWPRLGCPRLYQTPVDLGWLGRPRREEELNPLPFYF